MLYTFTSCFRYILAQEHGDLINLPDWFQSFKTIISHASTKGKRKKKQSMLPKKTNVFNESKDKSEALIQYPCCVSLYTTLLYLSELMLRILMNIYKAFTV